jgi:uncharacterized membrane protein
MTRWGYLAIVLVLAMFGAAAYAHVDAASLPGDKLPIHWDIKGKIDGWVAKDQPFLAFYLLPTVFGGIVLLGLFVLPWLSPENFAVAGFRAIYDFVFFLVSALFAYLDGVFLTAQLTGSQLDPRWLLVGIFVFFILLGPVLGKVKPNFWMGVRTPWTIADPLVWERTHRLAAWLFGVTGVIGAVLAILGVNPIACFVLLLVAALSPIVYSLVLYKRLKRAGRLEAQRPSR